MGEIIRVDFRKSPEIVRRKHRRIVARGRLRSIAAARSNTRSRNGVENRIERSELDTIAMEASLVRCVSGRPATPKQIAENLHLDLGDVKFAVALLEVEALQTLGPLHALMEPEFLAGDFD